MKSETKSIPSYYITKEKDIDGNYAYYEINEDKHNYLFYITPNNTINKYSTTKTNFNDCIKYPRRWESDCPTALYLQQDTPFEDIDLILCSGGIHKGCFHKNEVDFLVSCRKEFFDHHNLKGVTSNGEPIKLLNGAELTINLNTDAINMLLETKMSNDTDKAKLYKETVKSVIDKALANIDNKVKFNTLMEIAMELYNKNLC